MRRRKGHARADVRAQATALVGAGWDVVQGDNNHTHVYCPDCGSKVVGLPSTPRSGRWRVRVRTSARTHARRCWGRERLALAAW